MIREYSKMKISEMSKAVELKAKQIHDIIRQTPGHDLCSSLTGYDSYATLTYSEYETWENDRHVKKQHYNFEIDWQDGYDDFSEHFSCHIPCEVVDADSDEVLKEFFVKHFEEEFLCSVRCEIRDQLNRIKYSMTPVVIEHIDQLLANRDLGHQEWDGLIEPIVKKELARRIETRFMEKESD